MLLLITFCVVFAVQSYFYLFLFRKYSTSHLSIQKHKGTPVSIVIAAKNEENNLKVLLSSLAEQEHKDFEIIIVDDGSTDGTYDIIDSFQTTSVSSVFEVNLLRIPPAISKGKKAALTKGIGTAQYDHILLIDADCRPVDKDWISYMVATFSKRTKIVLGYGAYEKVDKSFLNKLIRFETLLTALQYFSYALGGMPYMGVGRNLAYKKEAFLKIGGFKDHDEIKSGDDDLFVSQVATPNNTAICDHQKSFTISKPHKQLSKWIRQKRRHITTANHYKPKVKMLLGLFFLSQLLIYVLFFWSLASQTYVELITLLFLIRLSYWYLTMWQTAARLNEKDLIAFGPLYEISIIFIQFYIFCKNIVSPPKHW